MKDASTTEQSLCDSILLCEKFICNANVERLLAVICKCSNTTSAIRSPYLYVYIIKYTSQHRQEWGLESVLYEVEMNLDSRTFQ